MAAPDLLALAARALAGAAVDADDAALLAALGSVVVPALGEVAALYTVSAGGEVTLAATVPPDGELTRGVRERVERRPDGGAGYAAIVAQGHPRLLSPPHASAPDGQPARPGQFISEIVAPLGSGAGHDALLTIGSTDPDRRYGQAELATLEVLAALLAARRAGRAHAIREADLLQQLEASAAAGRELAHQLNNDLTMPVGVVELLLDRDTLPVDLHEMIEAASKDLAALERHIREFHELMRSQSSGSAGSRPPEPRPGFLPY